MRVISSTELRSNLKKYLDLAATERILIQRGNLETFVLSRQEYLSPDDDLARAVTADELLIGLEEDIHETFQRRS